MSEAPRRAVAVTCGDPRGVGPEITLKSWLNGRTGGVPIFAVIGEPDVFARCRDQLGWDVPLQVIADISEATAVFAAALPVLRPSAGNAAASDDNAAVAIAAIDTAIALCRSGDCAAMVTNPIHKKTLWDSGFKFPGHTEYIADACGGGSAPIMMLMNAELKVVPVTVHCALAAVPAALSRDLIVETGRRVAAAMTTDFGIAKPRVAVAGLNPHAGEDGGLGREELDVIAPAIAALDAAGVAVTGPLPADTLFHPEARARYDVCLCMYHDQALIPLKTIDFYSGVNVTLGLPIVRTSPDHGTAFDIAGRGIAASTSLEAALRVAAEIARRRGGS